jgi:hypothetical protein
MLRSAEHGGGQKNREHDHIGLLGKPAIPSKRMPAEKPNLGGVAASAAPSRR